MLFDCKAYVYHDNLRVQRVINMYGYTRDVAIAYLIAKDAAAEAARVAAL